MSQPLGPRKRRTRQHVIADQSVNHVERYVLDESHAAQRLATDYGYDLMLMTFDEDGYAESGLVFLQLKASDALVRVGGNYSYDLDVRDYNLWKTERLPVVLVLFDAVARRAYWVHVQDYFSDRRRWPRAGAKTVRVVVPKRQVVNRRAVARMRAIKDAPALRLVEADPDD